MGFDKARCDECPLKAHWEKEGCWQPVDFEINAEGESVVIVGNAPSKSDMSLGRPVTLTERWYSLKYRS